MNGIDLGTGIALGFAAVVVIALIALAITNAWSHKQTKANPHTSGWEDVDAAIRDLASVMHWTEEQAFQMKIADFITATAERIRELENEK